MSNLKTFNFNSNNIRIVTIDNELWFMGADVCKVLEHSNPSSVYTRLKEYEVKYIDPKQYLGSHSNQDAVVISESGLYRLVLTSRKPQAETFQDWICQEVIPSIRKTGQYSVNQLPQIEEMSETELREHRKCIEMFQDSGDLQLAQLMKTRLGNKLLREQQQQITSSNVVEQYEGVVDIALRLGFKVPKNFESSLGKHVKKQCEHLLIGQNNRYSTASHKQVPANMYPVNNPEVEIAVREYCVSKAFRHRDINLLTE